MRYIPFFLLFLFGSSSLTALSVDEKIGQLFVVPARSSFGEEHRKDLINTIRNYHIGAIILKQGDPLSQIQMIELLQKESKIPLLCVQDAEWGLSMRLEQTIKFPKNLTLGAIVNNALIYDLGKEIGRQCKLAGVHINLAPVVDVNTNPKNPIIHMRSFGEDPKNVAQKAIAYMKGLASEGILSCAKHFPGHGDTSVDSHHDLPLVSHNLNHLQNCEFAPFQAMIEAGVPCMLSAHLFLPALEPHTLPATFSKKILSDLLRNEMHFKGLLITDALNMQALAKHYPVEEIGLKALLAGHDLLLYGDHIAPNIERILKEDVPKSFNRIKQAVLDGTISEEELDRHVDKILALKKKLSFSLSSENLMEKLNSTAAKKLKRDLYRSAITLVSNPDKLIPLESKRPLEWLQPGSKKKNSSSVAAVALYTAPSQETLDWIKKLRTESSVVIVLFQSPYTLSFFDTDCTLIMAYEEDPDTMEAANDLIYGRLQPQGRLPVTWDKHIYALESP